MNTIIEGLHVEAKVESIPGGYQHYYRNVYEAIAHETPLAVTAEEARRNIRVIELALESHRLQRAVPWSID